jgi:hypothetical protein
VVKLKLVLLRSDRMAKYNQLLRIEEERQFAFSGGLTVKYILVYFVEQFNDNLVFILNLQIFILKLASLIISFVLFPFRFVRFVKIINLKI